MSFLCLGHSLEDLDGYEMTLSTRAGRLGVRGLGWGNRLGLTDSVSWSPPLLIIPVRDCRDGDELLARGTDQAEISGRQHRCLHSWALRVHYVFDWSHTQSWGRRERKELYQLSDVSRVLMSPGALREGLVLTPAGPPFTY